MKLSKKVLAVTAILAVGILAGCGSSNSTAGSAASASASGVESSAASSEAAGEMGDVLPIDAGDLNEIKTGSYKFAASITKVADGQATKIIIPSELQGLAGLAVTGGELFNDAK